MCPFCELRFSYRSELTEHVETEHPDRSRPAGSVDGGTGDFDPQP